MRVTRAMCFSAALACGCATTQPSESTTMTHGATGRITAPPSSYTPSAPALDPRRGQEVGMVFEAYLTPHQEPDEEENTPGTTPQQFRSTGTSLTRAQREAAGHRGHGVVRFNRELSRAWVDVRVEGIDASTINMFHIHCGRPGILGPILVDFSLATDLQENLADGVFSVEVTNALIVGTTASGHGPIGAFTMGCVVPSPSLGGAVTRVSTVAGMAQIAAEGELYFNLHTRSQTYFGDIRGQILRAESTAAPPAAATTAPAAVTPAAPAPAAAAR